MENYKLAELSREELIIEFDKLQFELKQKSVQVKQLKDEIRKYEYLNQSLYDLAYHDKLTGLYNRNRIDDDTTYKAAIMCDIDWFKSINDKYDHSVGDLVLSRIGDILQDSIGDYCIAIRFGGEEFLILIDDEENAIGDIKAYTEQIIEQVRHAITHRLSFNFEVTLSYGYKINHNLTYTDKLIYDADIALKYSKEHGKDQVCEYDDLINNEWLNNQNHNK